MDQIVFQSCGADGQTEEGDLPSCNIYLVGADGTGLAPLTTEGGMLPAWAPDGRRIAFANCRLNFADGEIGADSVCDINVIGVDGSQLQNLTRNEPGSFARFTEDLTVGVWSPDGKRIAFTSCGPEDAGDLESGSCHLAVMNDDGSGLRNVAGAHEHIAWSPDSEHLAFTSHDDGTWDIYTIGVDGEELTNRTGSEDENTNYEEVRWSPDGSRLAYVSIAPVPAGAEDTYLDKWDIYVMDADGSNVTNLTNSPNESTERITYYSLDWSPDGEQIAFAAGHPGNDISVMKSDGSDVRCLTCDHPYGAGYDVAWSPDGTRILFTSDHDGNTDPYVMNGDGSGLVRLTDMPSQDIFASWSRVVVGDATRTPAGTARPTSAGGEPPPGKILFVSDRDGEAQTYVMNADGSDISGIGGPEDVWSADGRRVAATSCSADALNFPQSCAIYVSDAAGSGWDLLVKNATSPSWSSDGSRLAFLRRRLVPRNQPDRIDDIHVIKADGSGLTNLTASLVDVQYSLQFHWIEWSPDGRTIAVTADRDSGDEHIYLVNTDGSGLAPAFNREQGARALGSRWSPDGGRIAFSYCPPVPGQDSAYECDVAVINADGSGFARLATGADADSPAWSPDGEQIAFDSGRDGDNREIYVMNADGSGPKRLTETGAF